jgi:hypothetical protein
MGGGDTTTNGGTAPPSAVGETCVVWEADVAFPAAARRLADHQSL